MGFYLRISVNSSTGKWYILLRDDPYDSLWNTRRWERMRRTLLKVGCQYLILHRNVLLCEESEGNENSRKKKLNKDNVNTNVQNRMEQNDMRKFNNNKLFRYRYRLQCNRDFRRNCPKHASLFTFFPLNNATRPRCVQVCNVRSTST